MQYGFNPSFQMGFQAPKIPEKYPGLNDEQKQWLDNKTANLTGTQKQIKTQELYKNAITINQQQEAKDNRTVLKNNMLYDSVGDQDPISKKQKESQYKTASLADLIKEKYSVDVTKDDNVVIKAAVGAIPNGQKLLADYLNDGDDSILLLLGLDGGEQDIEGEEVEQNSSTLLEDAGLVGLGLGGTLAGSKLGGEALKGIGKTIYGITMPSNIKEAGLDQAYQAGLSKVKPRTVIDTAIESPILQKGGNTLSSKVGMMGTKGGVGVQAQARANQIFKENITPIFKQADTDGVLFKYKDLFEEAKKNVLGSKKMSIEQKNSIISDIDRISSKYKGNTTLENLDLAKRDIVNQLPQKYFKGNPTSDLKEAQGAISSVFRDKVHSTIKNKYGVNSAKIYQDYANFKTLGETGKKAMTLGNLQGGAGNFVSTIVGETASPITTTAGKLTYKLGELFTKPTDFLIKKTKDLIKSGAIKDIVKNAPANMLAPDVTNTKAEFYDDMVNDAKEAIELINSGKKIPATNLAYTLGNKLNKEEKIAKLEAIINSEKPKKVVTPLEWLIEEIF